MARTEPADTRFHEHSFLGIFAGVVSVVVVGVLLNAAGAPTLVQGAVTAGAIGFPAAIEYSLRARRRDKTDDASRIRRGELRRPIGLVVAMFAAVFAGVLFLVDAIIGRIFAVALADGYGISHGTAIVVAIVGVATVAVFGFFASSYASHYFGKNPYLWTAAVVGSLFVFRMLLMLVEYRVTRAEDRAVLAEYGVMPAVLFRLFVAHLVYLGACLGGAWYGRRHHDEFLAKKLARMHRQASPVADPQQPSQAAGLDLLELLKKLGELRDAGLLTDEEFRAKKTEILARI